MNLISKINKFKFDTFLKINIGFSIFSSCVTTLSNYIWRNKYVSFETNTLLGIVGLIIGIPFMLWWYKKIEKGGQTAFNIFKWLSIAYFVSLPLSFISNYFTLRTLNNFSVYNPGYIFIQVTGLLFYIFVYIYLTNYWKKNYRDKKK